MWGQLEGAKAFCGREKSKKILIFFWEGTEQLKNRRKKKEMLVFVGKMKKTLDVLNISGYGRVNSITSVP